MARKALLFLGLTLAVVLLITSEVVARDLAETTTEKTTEVTTETKGLEEVKQGRHCRRCCHHGRCRWCCGPSDAAENVENP